MPADVVECAQDPILAAYDEGALADRIERHVIAGVRHLAHVADHQPTALEDALAFELVEFGVAVDPGGKRLLQMPRCSTRGARFAGQIDAIDGIA